MASTTIEFDERGLPIIEHLNFNWLIPEEKKAVDVTPDEGYAIYDPNYPWEGCYFLSGAYPNVEGVLVLKAVKIDELPEGSEVFDLPNEEVKE